MFSHKIWPSPSVSVIADETLNPLTLLQPVPQRPQGEWTSEKWDYWLSQRVNITGSPLMS